MMHARPGASARTIEVTFKDNYVMVGTAAGYEEGSPGFMMRSAQLGDSMSMFVVSSAVRDVRFL